MNNKTDNKKYTRILLSVIIPVVVLLAFRIVFMTYLSSIIHGNTSLKTMLCTIIYLVLAIFICLNIEKGNLHRAAIVLSVLAYIAIVICCIVTGIVKYAPISRRSLLENSILSIISNFGCFAPVLGVIPLGVTLYKNKKDEKKRNRIAIIVLTSLALFSCLVARSLPSIYLLLFVAVIVFTIQMNKDKKCNICLLLTPIILFIVCTLLSYVLSRCVNVENFIVSQYESYRGYIEGPWDCLHIFDGRMMDSIRSVGLFSGATDPILENSLDSLEEFKLVYTGTYCAPVNILLTYGWVPFMIMFASSIALIVSCSKLATTIENEALRWGAIIICSLLTAITLGSYLCFPRLSAPFGPIYSSTIDFGMLLVIPLLWIFYLDSKPEKEDVKLQNEEVEFDDNIKEIE